MLNNSSQIIIIIKKKKQKKMPWAVRILIAITGKVKRQVVKSSFGRKLSDDKGIV